MKRTVVIAVLIFLCIPQLFAQNGIIKELTGTVEIKRPGETVFSAAKAGMPVAKDTIISTGFKSIALVEMGSTEILVRALTRLSLEELSRTAGTETVNVSLQTGRVRVDVNPPAGSRAAMTLRGPNATASVRGTSFEFDTYTLNVLEGTVAFMNNRDLSPAFNTDTASNALEAAAETSGEVSASGEKTVRNMKSRADSAVLVKAGSKSELSPIGRVSGSVPVSTTQLVPVIKKEIDSGMSTAKEVKKPIMRPTRPRTGAVDLEFGGFR